jgi:hypothetical protein
MAGVAQYFRRFAAAVCLAAGLLAVMPSPPSGDYAAAAESLEAPTVPVVIVFEPRNEKVARRVAEICEERMYELAAQLGMTELPPIRVEIADDLAPYRSRLGGTLPRWGVAFALMGRSTMIVDVKRATQAWNSLETVIPHELSHLLIAERLGGSPLPVWFLEGLAKWQAGEWTMVDGWQLMNAVWSNQAPKLWQIQDSYPAGEEQARNAYRVSYAAFTYRFGEDFDRLPVLLDAVDRSRSFERAFSAVFHETPMAYYARFHKHLEKKYHSPLLLFQSGPLFSILAALFLILAGTLFVRKYIRMRNMPDDPGPA